MILGLAPWCTADMQSLVTTVTGVSAGTQIVTITNGLLCFGMRNASPQALRHHATQLLALRLPIRGTWRGRHITRRLGLFDLFLFLLLALSPASIYSRRLMILNLQGGTFADPDRHKDPMNRGHLQHFCEMVVQPGPGVSKPALVSRAS